MEISKVSYLSIPKLSLSPILLALLLSACRSDKSVIKGPLFTYINSSQSGLDFKNELFQEEISLNFDYYYNGGGVAIGDIDNDGLSDVFFTGNMVSNKLYRNLGNFQFEDITKSAGLFSKKWSNGATMSDINNDGLLDIYVSNGGPIDDRNLQRDDVYINNGDRTFSNQADQLGLGFQGKTVQSSFFDMDNDGDLDLWLNTHGKRKEATTDSEWIEKQESKTEALRALQSCVLYENINGKFLDISKKAGIQKLAFGLGVNIVDINKDNFLDIIVTNDYMLPDYLFINNGDKTFIEDIQYSFDQTSYFSMGCDLEDINNDGLDDFMVVDMSPEDHYRSKVLMSSMDAQNFKWLTLRQGYIPQYMNNTVMLGVGDGAFNEIGAYTKMNNTEWSWGPLLADFDNDGDKDIYITNGYYRETKNNDYRVNVKKLKDSLDDLYTADMSITLLKNLKINKVKNNYFENKGSLDFDDAVLSSGLARESVSSGAAYADLDNDGDLDLVVSNQNKKAFLIKNNSTNNFLKIKLKSEYGEATTIGSKIFIYTKDKFQTKNYFFTKGFMSCVEPIAHFGLSDFTTIDSVVVHWKDGGISMIKSPKANQVLIIDDSSKNNRKEVINNHYLKEITKMIPSINNVYQSDEIYDDFEKEILLPHKYSDMAAALAVGDLNNDGKEDFILGGAKGYSTQIFTQQKGTFQKEDIRILLKDKEYEDLAIELLDIDNDNDLDIYIASGGGGEVKSEKYLADRLYINQGNMVFKKDKNFPTIKSSTKVILPIDIDNDGDQDLFIGGRNVPGKFPLSPKSYLLVNNNGKFRDESEKWDISHLGMLTSAVVSDVNKDGKQDIVFVGEFLEPTILLNNGTKFESNSFDIDKLSGFWQYIHQTDINNDGKLDFVLGNLGQNNKFSGTRSKSLYLYANDFDDSGSLDIVLAKEYKGKQVPVRGKECSSEQMPFIDKKFKTYHSFASASLTDIYSKEKLATADSLIVEEFSHLFLIATDNGYEVKKLPSYAQLGPILDIEESDINGDNDQDLIIIGSIQNAEPETRPYLGNKGMVLIKEKDSYQCKYDFSETGIYLPGNSKNMESITLDEHLQAYIVSNNNGHVQIYLNNK